MFGKAPGGAGEIPPVCPDFLTYDGLYHERKLLCYDLSRLEIFLTSQYACDKLNELY
jgi:hypothetical protein